MSWNSCLRDITIHHNCISFTRNWLSVCFDGDTKSSLFLFCTMHGVTRNLYKLLRLHVHCVSCSSFSWSSGNTFLLLTFHFCNFLAKLYFKWICVCCGLGIHTFHGKTFLWKSGNLSLWTQFLDKFMEIFYLFSTLGKKLEDCFKPWFTINSSA